MKTFTEADYDFSGLPKSELDACLVYEYARESLTAAKEAFSVREQNRIAEGKSIQVKFGPAVQNLLQGSFLVVFSSVTGFPDVPWRHLSEKDKKIVFKHTLSLPHLIRYASTWPNPPLSFSFKEPETMTLGAWRKQCQERLPSAPQTDPIKSGFFRVNMKYGHAVLIEEFSKWLRNFEGKAMLDIESPETKATKTKPKGRQSIHDSLSALGAMRLRFYCATFTEAKKLMKPKTNGTWYASRGSCNRACDRAFKRFRELFGWLDSKPIHFTDGWGNGTPK